MDDVELAPLERERMLRLRAELQFAESQLTVARLKLETELHLICHARGVSGAWTIDFDRGVLTKEGSSG